MLGLGQNLFDQGQIDMLRDALGDEDLSEMFQKLPISIERATRAMDAALQSEDLNAIREAAHALKGVAGSFAALQLQEVARRLEQDVTSLGEARECKKLLMKVADITLARLPSLLDR